LIGEEFKELESQSIYFAHPEELNDPMEGFRDVFWSGDFIAWKNLFKHYLLCLERLSCLLIIAGEEHPISKEDMPVFSGEDDFPTDKYRQLFSVICNKFFCSTIIKYIDHLSKRSSPVRKDELFCHLSNIHFFAIETISSVYEDSGLITPRKTKDLGAIKPIEKWIEADVFGLLEKSLEENDGEGKVDTYFSVQRQVHRDIDLINRYTETISLDTKNRNLVVIEFPEKYLEQIEKLVYPDWYAACFMSNCKNSSVWGHYGDDHNGVCLMFKAENVGEGSCLTLGSIIGWGRSGAICGPVKHKFHRIDYKKGNGQIDFFRALGRLPIPTLNAVWYASDNGEISECADDILKSEKDWRDKYWSNFYRDITVKSEDWNYENEYRLILSSSMTDFSAEKDRTLKYDFSSLEGLVFGIKTKMEDKLKIIKIIENKCKETDRKDFKFYQAYYSTGENCVEY
jgi:hypothetical protein